VKSPLTSKQRAFAVRFGYHHQPDKWFRWKIAGTAIAVAATLAWVAWGFWDDDGVTRYSHGPLATVHATWEAKCSACHVDFIAIRDDA
jgi:hypothetical protein